MRTKTCAFLVCLFAFGCVQHPLKPGQTVWLASIDNGDKPGVGVKLTETGGSQFNATVFLLDPNQPHDFKAGRAVRTKVLSSNSSELSLLVHYKKDQNEKLTIKFQGILNGNHVGAILTDDDGKGRPIELDFNRQP